MRLLRDRSQSIIARYLHSAVSPGEPLMEPRSPTEIQVDAALTKPIRDQAWPLVQDAKGAAEAIRDLRTSRPFLEMAFRSYKQVNLDGSVLILLRELLKATSEGRPEAMQYLTGMKEASDAAHANLREMKKAATQLAATTPEDRSAGN
jgi:hypothetical protein